MDITNQWALVTGSSRGVGQQIAVALARRGCNVVLHGRAAASCHDTRALITAQAPGVETHIVGSPVDTEAGVQVIIDAVQERIGTPDILYNNVGIQNAWRGPFESSLAVWREQFQVNLFSAVQICNAFLPAMIERGHGIVVNVTSGIDAVPEMASYGAAKAGVSKMTREYAAALKDTGVHISALDPGWLRTDLGGPQADHDVSMVVPGALAPVLSDLVPNGDVYSAIDLHAHPDLQ